MLNFGYFSWSQACLVSFSASGRVIAEMDSLSSLTLIENGSPDTHHCAALVREISLLKQQRWDVWWFHSAREGNFCGDALAKYEHKLRMGVMRHTHMPHFLRKPWLADKTGFCSKSSMAMANEHWHSHNEELLPPILVYGPPLIFRDLESQYSHKYRFLKAFASQLPLLQFLTTQNLHPSSLRVVLCNPIQPLTADILRLLPSLRLVVTSSVGTDHIDLLECRRRGIQVVTVDAQFADDAADMAVGLLIDVLRKVSAADRYVREWVPSQPWNFPLGSKLGGKRVGIVGLGRIGGEVAKRLEAFSCKIMYHSRNKKSFVSYPFYSDVAELAANSDVLVICCSLSEQTRHIINREVMLALGREGVIINVGRGALIDEKELVRCLMKGEIGGAGLDVFENEPNVPKELFSLDNVVLSPHAAVLTLESFTNTREYVAESLEAFFSSNPTITPVMDD